MKYTNDAAMTEIAVRSRRLRKRKEKRTVRALSVSSLVLTVLLTRTITCLSKAMPAHVQAGTYGSLLFGETIGGYVLTAVIAFAAAVTVTLSVIRRRTKEAVKEHGLTEREDRNNEE